MPTPVPFRWIVAAALLLAAAMPCDAQERRGEAAAPERRLPQGTSRLSDAERRAAVALAEKAIEDAGLRTDERLYLVAVQWFHDKHSTESKALVTHYRTDGDLTLLHRVNLGQGRVEHAEAATNRPTALSLAEMDLARELALADERVRAALGPHLGKVEAEPMVLRGGPVDEQGRAHRFVRLLFKVGRDYLTRPVVHVDLTDGKVEVEQLDPDAPQ